MAILAPSVAVRTVSLESLVRPYANAPVQGARTRFYLAGGTSGSEEPTEPMAESELTWTWTAPVQVTTIDALGYQFTLEVDDEEQFELTRETHNVRVFSTVTPDAYVDTEVIDRLVVKNYKSGLKMGLNLTNPD